jgi:4-amino-4-deoxy-L-arabinose transferase-like glycosyltransferase
VLEQPWRDRLGRRIQRWRHPARLQSRIDPRESRAEAPRAGRAWIERRGPAALVLLVAALLLPRLGAAPFERAEIYFLDAARAMVESGDWVVPRYRGRPFFDKPALAYWLMAASMTVAGPTAAAGRLVSTLAAMGAVAATFWLGMRLVGRRAALCGAFVLATTAGFLSFGRLAMSDMLLALWCTIAAALGVRAFGEGRGPATLPLLGAVLGLGFLTKGPVALLLPGFALALLALAAHREGRAWPPARAWALAAAVFTPIALGWFVAVALRLGSGPIRYFFLSENLERFAGETYDAARPFWYYGGAYLALGLPWSPLLALAVARAWRGTDRALRFLLLWAACMAVPLSLSRGKIDYYLLPLLPALSLAIGRVLAGEPWRAWERWAVRAWMLGVAALLLLVARIPMGLPAAWRPDAPVLAAGAVALAAGVGTCLWAAARPRPLRVTAAAGGAAAALAGLAGAFFVPAFAAAQPQRALLAEVQDELRYEPAAEVVVCGDPARVQRALLFEARRAGHERCDLWAAATGAEPALFLLDHDEQQSVGQVLRAISEHGYLPAETLTLRGLLWPPAPGRLHLAANFATDRPEARRRENRAYKEAVRARRDAKRKPASPAGGRTPAPSEP